MRKKVLRNAQGLAGELFLASYCDCGHTTKPLPQGSGF